jgi:flagellar hook protein FlgE
MLSIITSGLNAAQKDLSVTANNLANSGTTGFKRSEATFLDVYSADPAADPRTQVGSGTALGEISRSNSQGQLKTTDNVTDLAISGRGFFTLARDDGSVIYTRAGNFTINSSGNIVDSEENKLQCFAVSPTGEHASDLSSPTIVAEKSPGTAIVTLGANAGSQTMATLKIGGTVVDTRQVTDAELAVGYATFTSPLLTSAVAQKVTGSFDVTNLSIPVGSNNAGRTLLIRSEDTIIKRVLLKVTDASPLSVDLPSMGPTDVAKLSADFMDNGQSVVAPGQMTAVYGDPRDSSSQYQGVFVQSLAIDIKGLINANYSDGSKTTIGAIALASFPYEAGLRPIGNTNFVESVDSGAPVITEAGAPAAGDIRSGALEQSNVDMTAELMQMLKAQQVYNGNARMMQTAVEMVSRITDKI